jgi:hypothetical protein
VNQAHLRTPAKYAYWGWILVAASLPCFWIAWAHHGTNVISLVVGVNLLFGGLRLVYWGKGGIEKRRAGRVHSIN